MGNVWDLRYEERSWFHAVTRSCKRALVQRLLLQCLHFYLCFDYLGPKCSCFTTKGIALRNEHGLQLLRRKGDVWWWKRTPVLVLVVQWCHLGWAGRTLWAAFGHQCPSCTDEENTFNTAEGGAGGVSALMAACKATAEFGRGTVVIGARLLPEWKTLS